MINVFCVHHQSYEAISVLVSELKDRCQSLCSSVAELGVNCALHCIRIVN